MFLNLWPQGIDLVTHLPPSPLEEGGGGIRFFGLFHKVEREFKMFLNPWPQGIDLVTPSPLPHRTGGGGNSFFRLIS